MRRSHYRPILKMASPVLVSGLPHLYNVNRCTWEDDLFIDTGPWIKERLVQRAHRSLGTDKPLDLSTEICKPRFDVSNSSLIMNVHVIVNFCENVAAFKRNGRLFLYKKAKIY